MLFIEEIGSILISRQSISNIDIEEALTDFLMSLYVNDYKRH